MAPLAMAQVVFPSEQLWGDVAAVARIDAAYARRFFENRSDGESIIGTPGADLIWAGGELVDAWPATPDGNDYAKVRDSEVETLLIGGNLDFATPPQWATRDLLPHLPNGHQVVLKDLGHSGDFWTYQPEAGTRLITRFLDTGTVDDSLYRPATVDFTPAFSHGAVAKILVGAMLGLGALTVLSLMWMARRVHRRGAYGRKASATLRTLYPIVLGLGGWFLGVLIVLVAFPGVPLDDQSLRSSPSEFRSASASTGRGSTATGQARRRPPVSSRPPEARSSEPGSGSTRRPTYLRSSPRLPAPLRAPTSPSSSSTCPEPARSPRSLRNRSPPGRSRRPDPQVGRGDQHVAAARPPVRPGRRHLPVRLLAI